MTDEEWAAAPRVPQMSVIRRALTLSQEEFARAYHIPIGTLRDWERSSPRSPMPWRVPICA